MEKIDGRNLNHDVLTELRKRAVKRVLSGESPEDVTHIMGFSRPTIYKWLALYRTGGHDALTAHKRGGRPHKLNENIIAWVRRVVVESNPGQYGYAIPLWTRQAIAKLIYRQHHIKVSQNTVGRLLLRLGFTPQKPLLRAVEQDPELKRKCIEKRFPQIRRRARKRHAYIVFVDETGFMLNPLRRRTWAPRGQTPAIRISRPHDRISAIGAIAISPERRRFRFYFHLLEDNANFHGNSVTEFIDEIRHKIHTPMTLLWDAIPIHRAESVEKYIAKYRAIVVEPLPPYTPDLNPVDNVWSYVKYGRLPNYTVLHLRGLRRRINAELCRLEKKGDLLKSFSEKAGFTL